MKQLIAATFQVCLRFPCCVVVPYLLDQVLKVSTSNSTVAIECRGGGSGCLWLLSTFEGLS